MTRGVLITVAAISATVIMFVMAGCESSREGGGTPVDSSVASRRPAAYHPEQFPDIPFERLVGYRLTAEDQQIAIATAGGSLRRLSVTFITKAGDEPRAPVTESDRIAGGLTGLGWTLRAIDPAIKNTPDDHRDAFSKGDETLLVRTIADGNATTIAFQLEPRAQLLAHD